MKFELNPKGIVYRELIYTFVSSRVGILLKVRERVQRTTDNKLLLRKREFEDRGRTLGL